MFKNISQDKYFFTNITTLGWFVVLQIKDIDIEAIYTLQWKWLCILFKICSNKRMFCYLYYLLAIICTVVLQCIIKQHAIKTYWVQVIIFFQIIKWMPSYWDNKTLPTPTLTLPHTLFLTLTFRLFPSFQNKCLLDVIGDLKREKKKFSKRRIRARADCVKKTMVCIL